MNNVKPLQKIKLPIIYQESRHTSIDTAKDFLHFSCVQNCTCLEEKRQGPKDVYCMSGSLEKTCQIKIAHA